MIGRRRGGREPVADRSLQVVDDLRTVGMAVDRRTGKGDGMKKTIMVGLTGHDAQYRLDEDAYERLSGYLDRAASIALALILPVAPRSTSRS